jgi:hypothetical protein
MKNLDMIKIDSLAKTQELFAPYMEEIEKDFYKVFPNGYIYAKIVRSVGSPHLYIHFGLIGNMIDQSNGIIDNDPMQHKLMGHFRSSDYYAEHSLDDNIELSSLSSGISIDPPKDSYLVMGRVRTPFRKSTMPIAKQVPKLKKYFSELGKLVLANKDNLYKKDIKDKYLDIRP